MPIARVKQVGSAVSKAAVLVFRFPITNLPAVGNQLVLTVALGATATAVGSITDPRGNVWTRDGNTTLGGVMNSFVWSTTVTTPYVAGDSITVSPDIDEFYSGVIVEYSGLGLREASLGAQGTSLTPASGTLMVAAGSLVVGVVAVNGPSGDGFTEAPTWLTALRLGSTGGSQASNLTLNSAYNLPATAGPIGYSPVLGVSRKWGDLIVVYTAAAPAGADTTAPIVTLGTPSKTRISRVPGADITTVSFTANEATQGMQVRLVPGTASPVTAGTLIEQDAVARAANVTVSVDVTDDELVAAGGVAGANTVKFFMQDSAGNWSVA